MTPREAFAEQAQACRKLGSPLTAAVCDLMAEHLAPADGAVAQRVLDWPGDPRGTATALPLRLAGGLHRLVLDGAAPDLAAEYATGAVQWGTLRAALRDHEAALLKMLDSPPQTNEVARSGALVPAAHFALGQLDRPLRLAIMELGASAGLNLGWPRFRVAPVGSAAAYGPPDAPVVLRPEWQGDAPPPQPIEVVSAAGVDLNPVRDPENLLAYCWADQPERMARLRAAADEARARPPQIAQADAGQWLQDQLAVPAEPGALRLVQHSIAWQYFAPATRDRALAALETAGLSAGPDTPLAHLSMEADGQPDGAALRLRLWDGAVRQWHLARVDFHGRWVRRQPIEEAA
ncbi:DUF2332 family protein [Paracoccus suum]|uniref:DUF2332 family protein n=1 Tax=Paracoccus suum TaxID=2259340 RepID=A0A344PJF1_9RHOB|nr:DUF2332 family protein [Paracoccus suum]AXC49506.1 DUF2332 family protein [Paracoccus suum]